MRRDDMLGSLLQRCVVARPYPLSPSRLRALVDKATLLDLLKMAQAHGVTAYLQVGPLGELLSKEIAEIGRRTALRQLTAIADLAAFGFLMDDAGIRWLVVKGPVLATVHPQPHWRPYTDLDVIVPARDFGRAIYRLMAEGLQPLDTDWRRIRRTVPGQLHIRLPQGTVADVHWHLVNSRMFRRSVAIDMSEIHARARPLAIDGLTVRTLDPLDTIAHAALHAAVGGATRLIWLKDIERRAATESPDWDRLVARVHGWGVRVPVGVALERARRFLDANIPVEVIDELLVTDLRRRLTRALDTRWQPVNASSITPATIWAQVARDSWAATGGALLRRLFRPLQTVIRRHGPHQGRGDTRTVAWSRAMPEVQAYVNAVLGEAREGQQHRRAS